MTHPWDEFSKSLSEKSVPRRQSLRLLGAALAGVILSPLGVGTAWAAGDPCKPFCNRYPKAQRSACLAACQACSGDTSRVCGSGWSFACCTPGTTCCGGYCTDLADDFNHCGACGAPCAYPGPYEDGACVDGQCFYWCVEGAIDCGGTCTAVSFDSNNCGACGNACDASAPDCIHGVCGQCPPGLTPCSVGCIDVTWDNSNCGACGNVCPPQFGCSFGVCHGTGGGGDYGYGY